VRLALFVEMVKHKEWTPATLAAVGGAEGVGVAFLEETFSAATAPPRHRVHQTAVRNVLRALLPGQGTDIKGHMRSRAELIECSGYQSQLVEFDELLRILDGDLRLLTPTDPEGISAQENGNSDAGEAPQYYQLTHDFLVRPLREWLTRKQKETRAGRAELRLAERSALWNAKPERKQLPSKREWAAIGLLTKKKNWTDAETRLMRAANRYHWITGGIGLLLLLIILEAGMSVRADLIEERNHRHAESLVKRLLAADMAKVPEIIKEFTGYRRWAVPLLKSENDNAADNSTKKLYTSIALLPDDPGQVDTVLHQLLVAPARDFSVLRDILRPHAKALIPRLWEILGARDTDPGKSFRAACALAAFAPDDVRWQQLGQPVTAALLSQDALEIGYWIESLRPVKNNLIQPLFKRYLGTPEEYAVATGILADYASDNVNLLCELLEVADIKQFPVIFAKLQTFGQAAADRLSGQLGRSLLATVPDQQRDSVAARRATMAVALVKLGADEQVWAMLAHASNPSERSYLIHRLAAFGVDSSRILNRLEREPDPGIRAALILVLGDLGIESIAQDRREPLLKSLLAMYRDHPKSSLHAAAGWTLRRFRQDEQLSSIDSELANGKLKQDFEWYVNQQQQTMVVFPTGEFVIGSPETEQGRGRDEVQHTRKIERRFALSATEVTEEQYQKFLKANPQIQQIEVRKYCPDPRCARVAVDWYDAAAYCNWLSASEGLPSEQWCYLPNDKGLYGEGMSPAPDIFKRTGYRLPTEIEWEYACRAGTVTPRYYGSADSLLPYYAWFVSIAQEHSWPVGYCKPNPRGLFDMHGNVSEWCQGFHRYDLTVELTQEQREDVEVNNTRRGLLRGASYDNQPRTIRSATRIWGPPMNRTRDVGFRPARTLH